MSLYSVRMEASARAIVPNAISAGPTTALISDSRMSQSMVAGLRSFSFSTNPWRCSTAGRRKSSMNGVPALIMKVSMVSFSLPSSAANVPDRASATSCTVAALAILPFISSQPSTPPLPSVMPANWP